MIEIWTDILETAMKNLQTKYAIDVNEIINENDLKYKVRQHLEALANDENDMLVKPEVPWYDSNQPGHRVRFYFDLTIFKKSAFSLQFRDKTLRNKGYYYDDCSLAIMKKFAKPHFNFAEITDDLDKLQIFANETSGQFEKHKPVLIIGCSDKILYEQASKRLADNLKNYDDIFLKRLSIFLLSQDKVEHLKF
jgi:hypothetical protein